MFEKLYNPQWQAKPIELETDERSIQQTHNTLQKSENDFRLLCKKIPQNEEIFRQTFEKSPVGIAIVGLDYRLIKVNQKLCRITGYNVDELLEYGMPAIALSDDLYSSLHQTKDLVRGNINQFQIDKHLVQKNGTKIWTRLSLRLIRNKQEEPLYFISMIEDIDERRHMEEEKDIQLELFNLISKKNGIEEMVETILSFFKTWSGVDAIAIRLRRGKDFPYYKTCGFSKRFVSRENSLFNLGYKDRLLKHETSTNQPPLECMCGYVINALNDPTLPSLTDNGSFLTNNSSSFLSQIVKNKMPPGARKHCNEAGYESILLVPLRLAGNTLGLIQLNHKKTDHFSPEFVALMERHSHHVSVALAQRLTEENLKIKQLELKEMNTTLKILFRSREEDLLEHDRGILINIQQLILPCIDRLRLGDLDTQQKAQLSLLENNLKTISSSFAKKMFSTDIALTPSLIPVADMIRKGISNKEIANLLGISVKSVETYRKRIRKRLNLQNSKTNLRAYLLNME